MPNRNVKVYIQAYKQASKGATTLQGNLLALNGAVSRCWRRSNVDFPDTVAGPNAVKACVMVNWGTAFDDFDYLPTKAGYFILNQMGVKTAQNKRSFFQTYSQNHELNLPQFWTDSQRALNFLRNTNRNGEPVIVERHKLTGHSGAGIRLVKEDLELRDAPLYVQYIPKATEYRVHFFKHPDMETQYFIQQKRLRAEDVNAGPVENRYKIRNLANGWVFCHQQVENNDHVNLQAAEFANITNLDFGAIDIIYNRRANRATILEVNTAPGLEGETGKWYAKNIEIAASRHNFSSTSKVYSV